MTRFKRFFTLTAALLLAAAPTVQATSVLKSINRIDESSRMQLFLRFSELPAHELITSGRRIDLRLEDTALQQDLALLEGDERMIKMTVKMKGDHTLLSLYFRYEPQKTILDSSTESGALMLDILLGNAFSATYPDLSTRLQGIAVLQRPSIDFTNPLNLSAYAGDWKSFFSKYESPVTISPPLRLSLPPFPLAVHIPPETPVGEWLTAEILNLAGEEQWKEIINLLREHLTTKPDALARERILLTYAETLVRAGEYKEPHKLLQQIALKSPETMTAFLANLLFANLQGSKEDTYLAYYEYERLFGQISADNPFKAYSNILLAETAITAGRLEDATTILQRDDVAYNDEANALRRLRSADILYLQNEEIKALVTYLQLAEDSDVIDHHPMSLANFSNLLYSNHRQRTASSKYLLLSNLLRGERQHDLALFRLAMARLHSGASPEQTLVGLVQLRDAFPGTEGGYRARMKQVDLDYLSGRRDDQKTLEAYKSIAIEANKTSLREEATFKQALVEVLSGDPAASLESAMQMIRNFQTGQLRIEAKALIIEQLPGVLKKLIETEEYIEALVLMKKNRSLFARGWVAVDLLYDLAEAYLQLGFFDRAVRTFEYIFEVSDGEEREKVYLPLLRALYDAGQYDKMEDFADRFLFRYPDSEHLPEIFMLRVNSLLRNNQPDAAVKLLDSNERPKTNAIEHLAARTYFDQERWGDVIEILTRVDMQPTSNDTTIQFMLAESYYQNKQHDQAEALFNALLELQVRTEQSMFRLAQIDVGRNNTASALNRFRELTEKGKDPLWIKLAREEAAILTMQLAN